MLKKETCVEPHAGVPSLKTLWSPAPAGLAKPLRLGLVLGLAITSSALAATPGWEADRRLTNSNGPSTTSINFARSIATDEAGRVHVVWSEETESGVAPTYQRSLDAGSSWEPPIRLVEGAAQVFNPSVAAADGIVFVAWQDNRQNGSHIYFRRSIDGGVHWQPEQRLTSNPAGNPSVAMRDGAVHVVYGRPLGPEDTDIFYRRSLDGGATWKDEVQISELAHHSWVPTVAVAGDHVYIAWADTVHAPSPCCDKEEEYLARSSDRGATWSAPIRLTFDPPDAPANSWAPSLAANDNHVWIVFFDERSGGWEIYTKHSQDYGSSWSADHRLTFSEGNAFRPSIAHHGTELFVAYWDNTPGEAEEISSCTRATLARAGTRPSASPRRQAARSLLRSQPANMASTWSGPTPATATGRSTTNASRVKRSGPVVVVAASPSPARLRRP